MTVVTIVMGQTVLLMNLINTALHTLENKFKFDFNFSSTITPTHFKIYYTSSIYDTFAHYNYISTYVFILDFFSYYDG